MDNANPTILNATDLPTRRRRSLASAATVKESTIYSLLEMKSSSLVDHYEESDPEIESEDDATIEPIDEQEIYGTPTSCVVTCSYCYSSSEIFSDTWANFT